MSRDGVTLTIPTLQYQQTMVEIRQQFEIVDKVILQDIPLEFSETGLESGIPRGLSFEWGNQNDSDPPPSFYCQFSTLQKYYEASLKEQKSKIKSLSFVSLSGVVVPYMEDLIMLSDDNRELTFVSPARDVFTVQKSDNVVLARQPLYTPILDSTCDLDSTILIVHKPEGESKRVKTYNWVTIKYSLMRALIVNHSYKVYVTTPKTPKPCALRSHMQSSITNLSATTFKNIVKLEMLLAGADMTPQLTHIADRGIVSAYVPQSFESSSSAPSSAPHRRHRVIQQEPQQFLFSKVEHIPIEPITIFPYSTFMPLPEKSGKADFSHLILHFDELNSTNQPHAPSTKIYVPSSYFTEFMDVPGNVDVTIDGEVTANTFVDKNNQNWVGEQFTEMTCRQTFPPLATISCIKAERTTRQVVLTYIISFDVIKNVIISIDKIHSIGESTVEAAFNDSVVEVTDLVQISQQELQTSTQIDSQFTSGKLFFRPVNTSKSAKYSITLSLNRKTN